MKLYNVTIGADPEMFIVNTKNNKVVSAVGKIPGTKSKPYVANDMPKGFALETDNILVEFNIPPCTTCGEFVNNIEYMKNYTRARVTSISKRYDILCASSQHVPESQLKSKQAKEIGCDEDFNVYTKSVNKKPDISGITTRTAGMHIHIGYDNKNIETSLKLIRYLDVFVGIPSILKDNDKERRTIYGGAGCFRLTSYGVEYRSLGSAMMKDQETLIWLWYQIQKAIEAFNNNFRLPSTDTVIHIINNSDVELAKKLVNRYSLLHEYNK